MSEHAEVSQAEQLAMKFHETYERLAPYFSYQTRKESAIPWAEVPENNRNLMIAVCKELLADWSAERDEMTRLDARNAAIEEIRTGYCYSAHCDLCRAVAERERAVRLKALEEAAQQFERDAGMSLAAWSDELPQGAAKREAQSRIELWVSNIRALATPAASPKRINNLYPHDSTALRECPACEIERGKHPVPPPVTPAESK